MEVQFNLFVFLLVLFIGFLIIYSTYRPDVIVKKKRKCKDGDCLTQPE